MSGSGSDSLVDELAARLAALDAGDVCDPVTVAPRPSPTVLIAEAPLIATASGGRAVGTRFVLGRTPDDSPLMSRQHAELWPDGGALLCRDLGSTNGTVRVRDGETTPIGTDAAALLVAGDVLATAQGVELLTVLEPLQ